MFGNKKKMFKCPVRLPNGKKCGKKCASLEALAQHADRAHGGRGREL